MDTVGAGDSFTTGLPHRLAALGHLGGRFGGLSLDDITDASSFAARVAALTCSVPGANPPRADEAAPEGDVRSWSDARGPGLFSGREPKGDDRGCAGRRTVRLMSVGWLPYDRLCVGGVPRIQGPLEAVGRDAGSELGDRGEVGPQQATFKQLSEGFYDCAGQISAWATMTFSPLKVIAGPSCSS